MALKKSINKSTGLIHFTHYKNGLAYGADKAFYENGVMSYEGNRFAGKQVGEWIFRYDNKNIITYEFYNDQGRNVYLRKYDENGKLLSTTGSPLVDLQLAKSKLSPGAY